MVSRIPFQFVGILPFSLGAVLAWRTTGVFDLPVFCLSLLAVILIMLSTYSSGEFYDLEGDRLSASMERNTFSGGTQAILKGMVPASHAKTASYFTAAGAILIGIILQFYHHTGPWTIPLGVVGLFAGFFYSTEPIRLVKRGVGEVFIGLCYGWLPVATSFYLQTSHFTGLVHWMSIPIALSIFNVILINEFPDYPADIREGKANLVVRFGKPFASRLYACVAVGTDASFAAAIMAGAPALSWAFLPLIAGGTIYVAMAMIRGGYSDRRKLEMMCAVTYLVNLLISAAFLTALWNRS